MSIQILAPSGKRVVPPTSLVECYETNVRKSIQRTKLASAELWWTFLPEHRGAFAVVLGQQRVPLRQSLGVEEGFERGLVERPEHALGEAEGEGGARGQL